MMADFRIKSNSTIKTINRRALERTLLSSKKMTGLWKLIF